MYVIADLRANCKRRHFQKLTNIIMIGQTLSPILEEIEATLLEHTVNNGEPQNFTDDGFRAATHIFLTALLDRAYRTFIEEHGQSVMCEINAELIGQDVRFLIQRYTGIDTRDLYNTPPHTILATDF